MKKKNKKVREFEAKYGMSQCLNVSMAELMEHIWSHENRKALSPFRVPYIHFLSKLFL